MSDDNVECPSGLVVKVRKAKIRDFQLLQDRKEVKAGRATANLIAACVTEVVDPGPYTSAKIDWTKVLVGDQMVAMMAVRRVTHGDAFDFDVTCPVCRARIAWSVNLSELPVQKYSSEAVELFKARKPCVAMVLDKQFEFDHVTVDLAARAAKLIDTERRAGQGGKQSNVNALAEGVLVRLLSVEGVEKAALREWVEDLDLDVLKAIRKALEKYDGGVETEINVECESCGAAPEIELPLDLRRFWLSGV